MATLRELALGTAWPTPDINVIDALLKVEKKARAVVADAKTHKTAPYFQSTLALIDAIEAIDRIMAALTAPSAGAQGEDMPHE